MRDERMRFAVATVVLLAEPARHELLPCMQRPWPQRIARQLQPLRQPLDCCTYHSADWHKASKAAIAALRVASRRPPDPDLVDAVDDARYFEAVRELKQMGLDDTTLKAARSLFDDPVQPAREFYINGRHRACALLDLGVRRTVVGRGPS